MIDDMYIDRIFPFFFIYFYIYIEYIWPQQDELLLFFSFGYNVVTFSLSYKEVLRY